MEVSLVIPAFNEEENLRVLLPMIPKIVEEVIVVDSTSIDKTVEVAESFGAKVVQAGAGKGVALLAGMSAASGKIIVTMDGDCSQRPGEIVKFVEAIRSGYDVVIGSRFIPGGGSDEVTPFRRFGIFLFKSMINVFWKTRHTDVNYGFRAFTKDVVPKLNLKVKGFDMDVELVIHAARKGIKVLEIPCYEHDRAYGTAKLRAIKDGWLLFRRILLELACKD